MTTETEALDTMPKLEIQIGAYLIWEDYPDRTFAFAKLEPSGDVTVLDVDLSFVSAARRLIRATSEVAAA